MAVTVARRSIWQSSERHVVLQGATGATGRRRGRAGHDGRAERLPGTAAAADHTLDGLRRDVFDNERPYVSVNLAVSPSSDGNGEVVVGQVIFFVIFDAVLLQKLVYIEDIYVRPEYRRRGVGLALWKSAAEQGVLRDCDGLRLEVLGTNKEAVDFYAKRGARDLGPVCGFQHFKLVWDASSDGIKA
ncbi:hypothetical protein MRX96_028584 [Rhipicephalus microplus]